MHLHKHGRIWVVPTNLATLLSKCVFNHTGSSIDDRMWKRGSGTWPFKCERVLIKKTPHNAHGPQTLSAHIDYGNKDVVIQYNSLLANEGGFTEVLGDNVNCGYRYNISINDGYREDPDVCIGTKRAKYFGCLPFVEAYPMSRWYFFFNNTIFVDSTLNPEIYVWPESGDVHIANNIIYMDLQGRPCTLS